jgi:uncharacterized lipoprotein YmbA
MSIREIPLVGLLAVALSGCASPQEHFYTLLPDGPHPVQRVGAPLRTVVVATVTVPEAVNRSQLVLEVADHERVVLEQERWIEPVGAGLQRAIAQQLAAQLTDTAVALGGERLAGTAALHVHVQVRRFDLIRGEGARLDAHWVISGKDAVPVREEDFSTKVAAAAQTYEALVRAQSSAVVALADQIARALSDASISH